MTTVVETESPLHVTDLLSRVAGMWGVRARSRIQARILDACQAVEQDGASNGEATSSGVPLLEGTAPSGRGAASGFPVTGLRRGYREVLLAALLAIPFHERS